MTTSNHLYQLFFRSLFTACILTPVVTLPVRADFGPPTLVERVRASGTGSALIDAPDGCFNSQGVLLVSRTDPARKEKLAIAVAAFTTGKRIVINRVNNPSDPCAAQFGYPDEAFEVEIVP